MERLGALLLESPFIGKIWGGNRIQNTFDLEVPSGNIGEYWAVSVHPNGPSTVKTEPFNGLKLADALQRQPERLLGKHTLKKYDSTFPLLVKFIDAHDRLSVQVHPDDEQAKRLGDDMGKSEMWYILKAEPGAKILYGLQHGINRERLEASLKLGQIQENLRFVEVQSSDVIYVPPGALHTLMGGLLLLEIEQNSEANYRLYDWDRLGQDGKPRELHLDKAFEVIDYKFSGKVSHPVAQDTTYGEHCKLLQCPYFQVERYFVRKAQAMPLQTDRFQLLLSLSGTAQLSTPTNQINLRSGDPLFLPAELAEFSVTAGREGFEYVLVSVP
jgi:mannose-6-phosphate isomerase